MNKSEIRKKILKIRAQNSSMPYQIDFNYLLKTLKRFNAPDKTIGGYYPFNYEIDTIKVLEKLEKRNYRISLPKIKKNYQMNFFAWSTKDPLGINEYGIPEPVSKKILYPNILLVPLVAFDNHLNRIGYGAGFYDRYIKKIKKKKKIITIGLAYDFQKIIKVPINKHDLKLDYIITNRNSK